MNLSRVAKNAVLDFLGSWAAGGTVNGSRHPSQNHEEPADWGRSHVLGRFSGAIAPLRSAAGLNQCKSTGIPKFTFAAGVLPRIGQHVG